MIRDYVKSIPEIGIASVREDNGYSGVNFARPAFSEMMKDIEAGKINCVIIKDFSRLGRNYIEVGEFVDEIFPKYNVRLISMNDRYDSLNPRTDADEMIIPFKHLIDEHYLRESSKKIRSSLSIKRKNGDFVSAFAPYGYKRDEADKNMLVVEDHAAETVRSIFRMKIEGMSQQKIAEYLNGIGEPSPAENKKKNTNYKAKFQTKTRASWSAVAIGRILRNPVYIGTMVQGKQTTANYKVKRRINKPENEWSIVAETHEGIIKSQDFEIVNDLLGHDTRTAPKQGTVYPLSGLVYCGDCGNNMIRTKSDKLYYYICATSRSRKRVVSDIHCTSHCIQQIKLESSVMEAIEHQIALAIDIEKSITYIKSLPQQQRDIVKLNTKIIEREEEIKACEGYKRSLYEDYKNDFISKEDYIEFGKDYAARIAELRQAVIRLREETELFINNDCSVSALSWLEHFTQYQNLPEFSRQLVVNLVERIEVMEGKRVIIQFRYGDRMESAQEILNGIMNETINIFDPLSQNDSDIQARCDEWQE